MVIDVKWKKYCTYSELKSIQKINVSAVYIYIFLGTPHRVIYVGTAEDLHKRLLKHWYDFNNGKKTIFRLEENSNQDIYDLMRKKMDYKKMIDKVWIPNEKIKGAHYLAPDQSFNGDWSNYLTNSYLPRLSIWYAPLEKDKIKLLESKIQLAILKNYCIGYYKENQGRWSWLGQIEKPIDDVKNFCIRMIDTPNELTKEDKNLFDGIQ